MMKLIINKARDHGHRRSNSNRKHGRMSLLRALSSNSFNRPLARIVLFIALIGASIPGVGIEENGGPLFAWPFHSLGQRKSEMEVQRGRVFGEVFRALDTGNVDALEKLASYLLRQQEPTPGGEVAIRDFHQAMLRYLNECPTAGFRPHPWESTVAIVSAWQKKYPASAAAAVAEGNLFLCRALGARGDKVIGEVPQENLRIFADNLILAREAFLRNRATGASDPYWYEKMIVIGLYSGMDREAFVKLVDEGMRAYPFDYDLAALGVVYMVPRWGGSHEQVVGYIAHVLSQASPETTQFVASRIYYVLLKGTMYYIGPDLIYLLHTTSDHIEQAMAAFTARYPDAANLDQEAVVSCAVGSPKLKAQLAEIGDSPLLYYWDEIGKGYYFSFCRKVAALDQTTQRPAKPVPAAGPPPHPLAFSAMPQEEISNDIIARDEEIEACWEEVSKSARFAQLGARLWLTTDPEGSPPTLEQLEDSSPASPADRGDATVWSEQTQLCSEPGANNGPGDAAVAAHLASRLAAVGMLIAGAPYGRVNKLLYSDAVQLADQMRAFKKLSHHEGERPN
jgi:hypothetical protein